MDSYGGKATPSHSFSIPPPLYSIENKIAGPETTELDYLAQDKRRSRTCLDSSLSSNGSSGSNCSPDLRACSSFYNVSNVGNSEKSLRRSQTLQEQYWACTIPDSLPPRPDRTSPRWDPNKEYQDLLDYTYPLNPKYSISKDDEESESDTFLHDSGVDLDSYNISCDSKFGSTSQVDHNLKMSRYQLTNNLSVPCANSTPVFKRTSYWGLRNPSDSLNVTSCSRFANNTSRVDGAKESISTFSPAKYDVLDHFSAVESSVETFQKSAKILSTTILPLHRDLDTDEEYLSLPPSLKELETLATHLKDLSLKVGQKGHAKDCEQNCHLFSHDEDYVLGNTMESSISDYKDTRYVSSLSNCENRDDSETNIFSSLRDMLNGGLSSQVFDMTGCPLMQNIHENKSLVQRIQRFCHHLDQLIQWLYSVAEMTDNWTAPKPNVESIQLSLSLYLKIKKHVAEQRTLADTIVKDGELLVNCMAVNSSVLKDTLTLISKQSAKLERHTESLYASVLEAMDTITEENLRRNGKLRQRVSLEMESS